MIKDVSRKFNNFHADPGSIFEAKMKRQTVSVSQINFFEEFDLGSGRTLAACLIHASRAREPDNHPSGCVCPWIERRTGE